MKKETVIAYKGLDMNFQCLGHQFEVGKTYEIDGEVKRCQVGFHSCENPLDVFGYYEPGKSRYALIEASGSIDRGTDGDTKIASGRIHIKAELSMPDFVAAAIKWVTSKCDPVKAEHSTGGQSASSATGYQSASSATGKNSVAMNIGIQGRAKAGKDGAIVLCNHNKNYNIRHIRASKVGENGIKPDTFYILNDAGEFEEAA